MEDKHGIHTSFDAGFMCTHAISDDQEMSGSGGNKNNVDRISNSDGIKKEPYITGDGNISCNWEGGSGNEPDSVNVEVKNDSTTAPPEPPWSAKEPANCFEAAVPDIKMDCENKESVACLISESSPGSFAVETTVGSNNMASTTKPHCSNHNGNPVHSTARRTRSSSRPFVVVPNVDSSDSEQSSDFSNIQGEVKLIKQEPQVTDSINTRSLRRLCRTTVTEVNDVRKVRNQTHKTISVSTKVKGADLAGKTKGSKTCSICKKTFTRPESLTVHMRVHTGDRPYQCKHCDCTYKTAGHLRDHVRSKHSSSRPYLCTKCGKDFAYQTAWRRHEKTCGKNLAERVEFRCETCEKEFVTAKGFAKHKNTCGLSGVEKPVEKGKELPFKCRTCDKSFATSQGLERHQRFICGKVPAKGHYTCEECGKIFDKKDRYHSHLRRHTGERPFKCTLCDYKFFDQGVLRKHVKRHEQNRMFRCSMCEAAFCEKQTLSVHVMRIHCGLKPYKCNECEADFSAPYQLSKHIRKIHGQERPFKCSFCSEDFFEEKIYKKHMYQHTVKLTNLDQLGPKKPKQHTCNVCKQTFFWLSLRVHVASEHPGMSLSDILGREVLKCNMCTQEFSCKQTLRVHKRTHSTSKRYKCDKCERQFTVLSALRFHSNKHTQDRPHCCQDCGKTFRWISNLSHHRLTHHTLKQEVPINTYICNDCGRKFQRENCLYVHLRMKTPDQGTPCICCQCGRGYIDIGEYKMHMTTHSTVSTKPYICSECGAGFYFQHILNRHNRQRHGQPGRTAWLCEECGKYFTRKVYLQRHKARHSKYPQGKIPAGRSRLAGCLKIPTCHLKIPAGYPKTSADCPRIPRGLSRKDTCSSEPLQQFKYSTKVEAQSLVIREESQGYTGSGYSGYMPPGAIGSESQGHVAPEECSQPNDEFPTVTLFELQNYQSQSSTFINQTLEWPKPDNN